MPTGETIYLLRQVDDFTLSCSNESVSADIYNQIGGTLQITCESDKPFAFIGLVTDFSGIDIEKYRDYIKISCHNYIDRAMIYHH